MKNISIDYKILASHFNKTKEGFRQLKKKHNDGKECLWTIYVKAYNFDKGVAK